MAAGSIVIDILARTGSFETNTKRAEKRAKETGASIDKAFKVGAAAVAAAGAAFFAMTKSVINNADSVAKASRSIGITTESLSSLQYAAELSGVSSDQLNDAFRRLNKGAADGNKAFAAMGVSVRDSQGNLKASDALLKDVSDKFASYKDGAEKSALAQELFGRSGANMISFLNSGSEGLSEMQQEAEKLGIVISGDLAKNSEIFNDNLNRIQKSVTGLVVQIAGPLVNALAAITTEFLKAAQAGETFAGALERGLSGGKVGDRSTIEKSAQDIEKFTAKLKDLDREIAQYKGQEIPLELQFKRDVASADLAAALKDYTEKANKIAIPLPPPTSLVAPTIGAAGGQNKEIEAAKKEAEDFEKWMTELKEDEEKHRQKMHGIRLDEQFENDRKYEEELSGLKEDEERNRQRIYELRLKDQEKADKGYWGQWLEAAQEAMTSFNDLASAVINNFTTGFGNAFEKMIFDGQNLKESFKGIAESMLRSIVNALAQMAAQWLVYQAVQLVVGKTTQAGASSAQTFGAMAAQQMAAINAFASTAAIPIVGPAAAPAAAGAALAATAPFVATIASLGAAAVGARATGGPVSADAPYLVGERGPELFVPSTAGRIVPNNALGGDSGSIVQNINISTGVAQTVRAEIMTLMPQIISAAKSAVSDSRMRGGSFGNSMR